MFSRSHSIFDFCRSLSKKEGVSSKSLYVSVYKAFVKTKWHQKKKKNLMA